MSARATPIRFVALGALVLAALAVTLVLLSAGSSPYVLRAHFSDAGGLVEGGAVKVAGRRVGKVDDIELVRDGLVEITLEIDDELAPLRSTTRARVRALGAAGIANHYVALEPGMSGPPLRDGAVLPASQTATRINYDAILDSFGPRQRARLKQLIAASADIYAGAGARAFNRMLGDASPALGEMSALTRQLADDRDAIARVIDTAAVDAQAIASRRPDLRDALANTATTMRAIAGQNTALASSLQRAPAVLDQARTTLANADTALRALRPVLAEVPPAAGPLQGFLRRLDTTLPQATRTVSQLNGMLPSLDRTLTGVRELGPQATPALRSAGRALRSMRPITRIARFYGSDLLIGVFQGLFSVAGGNYDQNGHYIRLEFTQPYQTVLGGPLAGLLEKPLLPGLFNHRTNLLRRCPGGNTPPAPDSSNPWVPDPSICTPSQSTPASVNEP